VQFVFSESLLLPPATLRCSGPVAVSPESDLGGMRGRFPQLRIKLGDPEGRTARAVKLVIRCCSQTPVKAYSLEWRMFVALDKSVKHFWLFLDFSGKVM